MDAGSCLVPRVTGDNTEEAEKLVWEGKQFAQTMSCFVFTITGMRGRGSGRFLSRKSFKVKNAGLIGHFYLTSVPLIVSGSFMRPPIGKEAASTSGEDRSLCAPHVL